MVRSPYNTVRAFSAVKPTGLAAAQRPTTRAGDRRKPQPHPELTALCADCHQAHHYELDDYAAWKERERYV